MILRKRSNRVGSSVPVLSPASRQQEQTNTDMFSSSPQMNTPDQCTVGDDVQASQIAISGQKPS